MTAASRPIYLYEDDSALAGEIVAGFAEAGLVIRPLPSEAEVMERAGAEGPSATLVMDRMIGDRDSLEIVAALRATGNRVPVLVISSRASVDDRIEGLKAGGDDYLVKPFAMGELIARVAALQRRADGEPRTRLVVGPLVLDRLARTVTRGSREIALLPREFSLLDYLMTHAGQTVTRAMLLEDVWNYRASTHTNVVDVHVGNLRRKIDAEGEPRLIASVRGLGFRLDATPHDGE